MTTAWATDEATEPRPAVRVPQRVAPHVLLVDPHAAFRQALAIILEMQPGVAVVTQAGSLAEARSVELAPNICVTELELPDGSGIDLVSELAQADHGVAAILLTASDDAALLRRAEEAGGRLMRKSATLNELLDAIRCAAPDEPLTHAVRSPEMVRLQGQRLKRSREVRARVESLTQRERDVLGALSEGLSDKEVASRLRISVDTVRTHLVSVFSKLGVDSRLQAVLFAVRHGIVQLT